jgi:glutaredoxin 3
MKIEIYGDASCAGCIQSKTLLKNRGIPFEEHSVQELLARMPSARQIPQIFIDDEHIGGFDQLKERLDA